MIDLWGKSSRDEFLDCIYIKANQSITVNSKLGYKTVPTGHFRAKIVNSYMEDNQVIGQAFMTRQEIVVLESHDNISDLQLNDKVIVREKEYRVDNIQSVPVKKQLMFMENGYSATYYLTLRR